MSSLNLMELCRLCLVKERVSIAIFEEEGDIRQIFHKIATCLPVKVVKDDKLPKKICNDCLFKVENVYQFWNTTANAEKQLLQWLEEVKTDERAGTSTTIETEQLMLKEEAVDQDHSTDVGKSVSREDIAMEDEERRSEEEEEDEDEPEAAESEEEGDASNAEESDEDMGEVPGKEEVESDEEPYTELEPTTFVNVSLACDEAGPSGMQQQTQAQSEGQLVTTEAPSTSKAAPAASGSVITAVTGSKAVSSTPNEKTTARCEFCDKVIPKRNFSVHRRIHTGEKPFVCRFCGEAFMYKRRLVHHNMKVHIDDRPFKCDVCMLCFKLSSELAEHRKIHAGISFYICECGFSTYSKGHYRSHELKHSSERPYVCEICNKRFKLKYSYKLHQKIHLGEKTIVCHCGYSTYSKGHFGQHLRTHSDDRPYCCDICNKTFKSRSALNKHKKIHTGEKNHVCHVCGYSSAHKSIIDTHLRVHTGERPFSCDICNKGFRYSSSLKEHRMIHSGEKNHICDICGYSCIQKSGLELHRKRHFNENKLKCDICEKLFSGSQSLKNHMLGHTGNKPFKCNICGVRFRHRYQFDEHKKTHDPNFKGVKEHKCDVCYKRFSYKSVLRTHIKIHTGDNQHICSSCGKILGSKTSLIAHTRIHTGEKPEICDVCGKAFSTKNYLKVHLRTHTGERPCRCDVCGKTFTQHSSLNVHKRSHHKKEKAIQEQNDEDLEYQTTQEPNDDHMYQCYCSELFVTEELLLNHQNTHDAELSEKESNL